MKFQVNEGSGSVEVLAIQSCLTLCDPHGLQPTRLLCPWYSPGTYTGMGSHSFLQGIFLIQASNPGRLSHQGSPSLERKAHLFRSGPLTDIRLSAAEPGKQCFPGSGGSSNLETC